MKPSDIEPGLRTAGQALGLRLTDWQVETLLSYLSMLQRWNSTYNLTSVREPGDMLTQHLSDCLAVINPLHRRVGSKLGRVLDVGSGGGLPGVVMAVLLGNLDVTCVDAVGKKAAFVRQVAAELRLKNLHSEHTRVEHLSAAPFDVITCRAFASLAKFFELTRSLLAPDGCWLAMKASSVHTELLSTSAEVDVFHVEHVQVPNLSADRCIVWARPRCLPTQNL